MNHLRLCAGLFFGGLLAASAQVPASISYQGRITSQGVAYSGPAQIKFALVGPNGTPVFWRNDGGTGAGEPTTAATVTVANGLFQLLLGDTNLANMAPLPAGIFGNPDVRVRIWLNAGTNQFTQLSPDQRIAATGYALMAADIVDGAITSSKLAPASVTAGHILSNSITAAQIASNSITGGQIAGGSITSNQLAVGTVGVRQLAKPYQAGIIPLNVYSNGGFQQRMVTHTVTFPAPFATPPIVTIALETPLRSAADTIQPINMQQKTASSFSLVFPIPLLPVTLESRSSIDSAPMSLVNSNPAVIYLLNNTMWYTRSTDLIGMRWADSKVVTFNSGSSKILKVVNNQPAVAYIDPSNNLRFVRATDPDGTNWPTSFTIAASSPTFRPIEVELEIVNGNPAVVCFDNIGNQIYYFRSSDPNGTTWPISGTLVATGKVHIALAVINGRPAVSFPWENGQTFGTASYQSQVRYIRANDTNGTSWPTTPVSAFSVTGLEIRHEDTFLMTVAGNPAIVYRSRDSQTFITEDRPHFVRASNADGTAWGSPVVAAGVFVMQSMYATMVNNQPAVAYYDFERATMHLAVSINNGASFGSYTVYRNIRNSLPWVMTVQGQPALTFSNSEKDALWYARDTNPAVDTYINWIAVER